MTPKEKAKQLVESMNIPFAIEKAYTMTLYQQKKCALICVDNIIDNCVYFKGDYWQEVKNEIEKL